MKKTLLSIVALMLGIVANAQFTESNAPVINDQTTLFLLDSTATDYASETGSSAIWDYSNLTGYNNATKDLTILDAADTSNNGVFNTSNAAFDIEDFFVTYMTGDASGRQSQGFIFNAASLGVGIVVARFADSTQEQLYTYPFNVGSSVTSNFVGIVTLDLGGPTDLGLIGSSTTTVDGEGTLKLAANDYSNVLRYKLVDTMGIILDSTGVPGVEIVRVQYEYYDHSLSNLPIFVHTDVKFTMVGDTVPAGQFSIVLGKDDPTSSISSNKIEQTKIYPNPTTSKLNIQLPSSVVEANVIITDAQGRTVFANSVNSMVNSIDVSSLKGGVYFVKIASEDASVNKTVVIK